jgi:DNA-binding transcriptional regulator YdaS (Cro superfamily)
MQNQDRFKTQRIVLGALKVAVLVLLTGCASIESSVTGQTICRELERDLPTYSVKDTPETLESGARFIDIFNAVCPQ